MSIRCTAVRRGGRPLLGVAACALLPACAALPALDMGLQPRGQAASAYSVWYRPADVLFANCGFGEEYVEGFVDAGKTAAERRARRLLETQRAVLGCMEARNIFPEECRDRVHVEGSGAGDAPGTGEVRIRCMQEGETAGESELPAGQWIYRRDPEVSPFSMQAYRIMENARMEVFNIRTSLEHARRQAIAGAVDMVVEIDLALRGTRLIKPFPLYVTPSSPVFRPYGPPLRRETRWGSVWNEKVEVVLLLPLMERPQHRRSPADTFAGRLLEFPAERPDERRGGIWFHPDGSSTGGRIRVAEGRNAFVVDVDRKTGRVEVFDGDAAPPLDYEAERIEYDRAQADLGPEFETPAVGEIVGKIVGSTALDLADAVLPGVASTGPLEMGRQPPGETLDGSYTIWFQPGDLAPGFRDNDPFRNLHEHCGPGMRQVEELVDREQSEAEKRARRDLEAQKAVLECAEARGLFPEWCGRDIHVFPWVGGGDSLAVFPEGRRTMRTCWITIRCMERGENASSLPGGGWVHRRGQP